MVMQNKAKNKSKLVSEIVGKDKENVAQCKICYLICENYSELLKHTKYHEKVGSKYQCEQCKINFVLKRDLKHHTLKEHNHRFRCDPCKKVYANQKNLDTHILVSHSTKEKFDELIETKFEKVANLLRLNEIKNSNSQQNVTKCQSNKIENSSCPNNHNDITFCICRLLDDQKNLDTHVSVTHSTKEKLDELPQTNLNSQQNVHISSNSRNNKIEHSKCPKNHNEITFCLCCIINNQNKSNTPVVVGSTNKLARTNSQKVVDLGRTSKVGPINSQQNVDIVLKSQGKKIENSKCRNNHNEITFCLCRML